jgi:hypothetical protein
MGGGEESIQTVLIGDDHVIKKIETGTCSSLDLILDRFAQRRRYIAH